MRTVGQLEPSLAWMHLLRRTRWWGWPSVVWRALWLDPVDLEAGNPLTTHGASLRRNACVDSSAGSWRYPAPCGSSFCAATRERRAVDASVVLSDWNQRDAGCLSRGSRAGFQGAGPGQYDTSDSDPLVATQKDLTCSILSLSASDTFDYPVTRGLSSRAKGRRTRRERWLSIRLLRARRMWTTCLMRMSPRCSSRDSSSRPIRL